MLVKLHNGVDALRPDRQELDPYSVLEAAIAPYETVARLRSIAIVIDRREPHVAKLDRDLAERALDTFLSFIVRHSSPGDRVAISIHRLEGPEPEIRISASTGIPEPPRLDGRGNPEDEELAFCCAISRAHKGRLRVDGSDSKGITLSFEL